MAKDILKETDHNITIQTVETNKIDYPNSDFSISKEFYRQAINIQKLLKNNDILNSFLARLGHNLTVTPKASKAAGYM
ncbi:hypothetical protein [Lactiplantibacillus plantarum]|uniref:hypothetical protein n=1 Tax=Lactiplantibacillus plantarum TaxID=1590 RepID=UPI000DAE12A0|nr:hypothetical protein [Lactiplantibacillus plantarum]KAF1282916.1 hypothetical protein CHF38_10980 [Lactiplantibacillus plantarum]RAH94610.1 hypothetical protein DAY22_10965 [Lactiplantibacillus plantarum]